MASGLPAAFQSEILSCLGQKMRTLSDPKFAFLLFLLVFRLLKNATTFCRFWATKQAVYIYMRVVYKTLCVYLLYFIGALKRQTVRAYRESKNTKKKRRKPTWYKNKSRRKPG